MTALHRETGSEEETGDQHSTLDITLIDDSDGSLDAIDIGVDELFTILSNPRRQAIIEYLNRADGGMSVRDLSEHVAAWENGTTPANLEYDDRKRVYTSLHQNHIPKMKDYGILESDDATDEVHLNETFRDIQITLGSTSRSDSRTPWPVAYTGLGLVGFLTAVGGGLLPLDGSAVPVLFAGWTVLAIVVGAVSSLEADDIDIG